MDNFNYTPSKQYQLILYTNGCSWIENLYLNRAMQQNFPDVLHINRGIGGNGNWQIIERSIADLKLLKNQSIPVAAYISFSEVSRNKKELSLVNPIKYKKINDYFRDILLQEHQLLDSALDQLKINRFITTSFINNCFNNNPSIVDKCSDPYKKEMFGLYALEYMKDNNKIFKFDLEDYIDCISDWTDYFSYIESSPIIDNTYHPCHVDAYQSVVEFTQSFL